MKKTSQKSANKVLGQRKHPVIILALVIAVVLVFLICGLVDRYNRNEIHLGDWLIASCTVLSMFGTVFLAIVSVRQSERANDLSEKLLKQNEELQKINETQFKIANQKLFPLLTCKPWPIKLQRNIDSIKVSKNWERRSTSSLVEPLKVVIEVDARFDKSDVAKYLMDIQVDLSNNGDVNVSNVEIYKIAIGSPLNNIVDVWWPLVDTIVAPGRQGSVLFRFFHDNDKFCKTDEVLNFSIFIKMKTLTGVEFYEKIDILSSVGWSKHSLEKLSMEKLEN